MAIKKILITAEDIVRYIGAYSQYVDYDGSKAVYANKNLTTILDGIDTSITNIISSIPTKTSDLTNDSDFQNETQVQFLIDEALKDITGIEYELVHVLPATGVKGTIYLLHNPTDTQDIYDEYIWIDGTPGHFEKIGTTEIDLSTHWSKEELTFMTNSDIDEILSS